MEAQLGTYGKVSIQFPDATRAVVTTDRVVINRIAVRFHLYAEALPWTDREGIEHTWRIRDAYIRRDGSWADDVTSSIRAKIHDAALVLIEVRATPTALRAAERHALAKRAENNKAEAADLREKARRLDAEAADLYEKAAALF
jgi:hypothetical protein